MSKRAQKIRTKKQEKRKKAKANRNKEKIKTVKPASKFSLAYVRRVTETGSEILLHLNKHKDGERYCIFGAELRKDETYIDAAKRIVKYIAGIDTKYSPFEQIYNPESEERSCDVYIDRKDGKKISGRLITLYPTEPSKNPENSLYFPLGSDNEKIDEISRYLMGVINYYETKMRERGLF